MLEIVIDKLWVVLGTTCGGLNFPIKQLILCSLSLHVQQAGRTDGYNQNISQIMPLLIGQRANFMVMLKKTKVR